MDEQGAINAHQLSRAPRGNICSKDICQAEPEPPYTTADGQYYSSLIYQQNGRYSIKDTGRYGLQPVAVVSSEGHHTISRTPSRNSQYNSGCRIPNLSFLCRMAIASLNVQKNQFATRLNHQLPQYISWRPDPFAMSIQMLSRPNGATFKGTLPPPLLSGGKVPPKSEEGEVHLNTGSPGMAITGVVPAPSRESGPKPSATPNVPQSTARPIRQPPSSHDPRPTPVGRLEGITWQQEFRKDLPNLYCQDGVKERLHPTNRAEKNGAAGAIDGKLIPFHVI